MAENTKDFSPRRIVLSRKGFDGRAGGVPSPIFPDGSMLSLPIPGKGCPLTHSDLQWKDRRISGVVTSLRGRRSQVTSVHLDPDLNPNLKIKGEDRQPGWRGLFGQSGAAQRALMELQPGDLFLFFGLFSRVIEDSQGLRYASKKKSAELNVLFGWLQVDRVETVNDAGRLRTKYPWAADHPHLQEPYPGNNNTLYIAREKLEIGGTNANIPGYGVFPYFSEELQLSEKDNSGSFWVMPTWLRPRGGSRSVWSSHPNGTTCWTPIYDKTENTVLCHRIHLGPGQEFVLDCGEYPESIEWALAKIRSGLSLRASTTNC